MDPKDKVLRDALEALAASGLGDKNSRDLLAQDLGDLTAKRVGEELPAGTGNAWVDRQAAAGPKAADVMSQATPEAAQMDPATMRSALMALKKKVGGLYGPR